MWEYAEYCDEWERVLAAWPEILAAYHDFKAKHWHLDPTKGDLYYIEKLALTLRASGKVQ